MEQQNGEKKSRKLKLFALVIIILVVAFAGFKLYSKPNNGKGKDDKVETKETKKYDQETLDLQAALEGMRQLFDNGKPGTTKADITPEELKDVKGKIDKLEDSDIKKDLLSEYERIEKGPTSSSNTNENFDNGEQGYSE